MTTRTHIAALIGLSSIAAAAGVATPASAAPKEPARNITCNLTLFAVIKQPAPTAANFGSANCGKRFGAGVQSDSSKTTRTSPTAGSFTGPFKMFFDRGTISGRFTISFETTLAPGTNAITGVTYEGKLKVTAGTGFYRRVRGSGTVAGTSPDAVKTTLRYKLKLSGLPVSRLL